MLTEKNDNNIMEPENMNRMQLINEVTELRKTVKRLSAVIASQETASKMHQKTVETLHKNNLIMFDVLEIGAKMKTGLFAYKNWAKYQELIIATIAKLKGRIR